MFSRAIECLILLYKLARIGVTELILMGELRGTTYSTGLTPGSPGVDHPGWVVLCFLGTL